MRSHNHVTKGNAAKIVRRKAAILRQIAYRETHSSSAHPDEFAPKGWTYEDILSGRGNI